MRILLDCAKSRPNARHGESTVGNFDGVHLGHQAMLERVTREARTSAISGRVRLTFEPHPREFFAPDRRRRGSTSLREKLELLAGLGPTTCVERFDSDFAALSAEEFVERVLVDRSACVGSLVGDDFRFGAARAGDFASLAAGGTPSASSVRGGHLRGAEGTCACRARAVRERSPRRPRRPARLLGRPYSISGRVVHGDRLRRALGFPTANVRLEHNRPLAGIFVVECGVAGSRDSREWRASACDPTVRPAGRPMLEVHPVRFRRRPLRRRVRSSSCRSCATRRSFPTLDALAGADRARLRRGARGCFRRTRHDKTRCRTTRRPTTRTP